MVEDETADIDTERYRVRGSYRRDVNKKFYWITGAAWMRDLNAGIENMTTVYGGLGNPWWDREDSHFLSDYSITWTRDIYRAMRTVKKLRAGIVWVNHMQPTFVEAPWGGYKGSGYGRELGLWGLEEYQEVKQVYITLDERPIAWY